MQCSENALAYFTRALIYNYKMFMKQIPGLVHPVYNSTSTIFTVSAPGGNPIKLFTDVIHGFSLQASVFVPGKPFQPILINVGKAKSLP